MKQMIYRRIGSAITSAKGADGYTVTARAETITANQLSEARSHSKIPPLINRQYKENLFYKQYQLDESTLAISCGYDDPAGERGSELVQTMMTESREERADYFARTPACSSYFADVKADYENTKRLSVEGGNMMLSLDEYLAKAACKSTDAFRIIREELGSEEMIREMFSALVDVSSQNARMIVVFLDDESLARLTDHSRRIAEALLSCLPDQIASGIGFLSPAFDYEENTTYGLRFALRSRFRYDERKSFAYVFDLAAGTVQKPRQVDDGAAEYISELASLIMRDDPEARARMQELRKALDDSAYYQNENVPEAVAIRYAMCCRCDQLQPAEIRKLAEWHHNMIENSCGKNATTTLENIAFWTRDDNWVVERYLPDMWDNQHLWKRRDQVYDIEGILRIFDDAQTLYSAGRPEAQRYLEFIYSRLKKGTLYNADPMLLKNRLLDYFIKCVEQAYKARDPELLYGQLYWGMVENWLRTVWLAQRPAHRSRDVYRALEKLYELRALDDESIAAYIAAYTELIFFDGRYTLYVKEESGFHRQVAGKILQDSPEIIIQCMTNDLNSRNPYLSSASMPNHLWYRAMADQSEAVAAEYVAINARNFNNALAQCSYENIPALLDELNGEAGSTLIAMARRLDAQFPAYKMIEKCIVALAGKSGIYGYYPAHTDVAQAVAELLDKNISGGMYRYMDQHDALMLACNLRLTVLSERAFCQFMDAIYASSVRAETRDNAIKIVQQSMRASAGDEGWDNAPLESLLLSVMLCSLTGNRAAGSFSELRPGLGMEFFDQLGMRESRLVSACKKLADPEAGEGAGYLAHALYQYLKIPRKKRGDQTISYPRPYQAEEESAEPRRVPLSGLPIAIPIAGTLVFAGGLAASVLGLIYYIGLM